MIVFFMRKTGSPGIFLLASDVSGTLSLSKILGVGVPWNFGRNGFGRPFLLGRKKAELAATRFRSVLWTASHRFDLWCEFYRGRGFCGSSNTSKIQKNLRISGPEERPYGTVSGMGTLLLNSDFRIQSRLEENKTIVVSLLIAEEVLLRYPTRIRKILPKRIPDLLRRYGKFLTATERIGNKAGRTLYQASPGKEKMKKINARIGSGSWALLGTFAQAHGVSRCFLFDYLLSLEEAGVGDLIVIPMNAGGPTFHEKNSYILHLDLLKNTISRTLQCDPKESFYVLDYHHWYP